MTEKKTDRQKARPVLRPIEIVTQQRKTAGRVTFIQTCDADATKLLSWVGSASQRWIELSWIDDDWRRISCQCVFSYYGG